MDNKNKCKLGKEFNAGLCTIRHNAENAKMKAGKPHKEECIKCILYKKYIRNKNNNIVIDLTNQNHSEIVSVVNNDINTVNVEDSEHPVINSKVTSEFIDLTSVKNGRNGLDELIQKYNDVVKSAKKAYDETVNKAERIKKDLDKYSNFLEELKWLKNNS